MHKLMVVFLVCLAVACSRETTSGCISGNSNKRPDPETLKGEIGFYDEYLAIEYINSDGDNLILNDTFDPGDISLEYQGELVDGTVVDLEEGKTKGMLVVWPRSEGKVRYGIQLSGSDKDTLEVNYSLADFSACTGTVMAVDSVFYNFKKYAVDDLGQGIKQIKVTKRF